MCKNKSINALVLPDTFCWSWPTARPQWNCQHISVHKGTKACRMRTTCWDPLIFFLFTRWKSAGLKASLGGIFLTDFSMVGLNVIPEFLHSPDSWQETLLGIKSWTQDKREKEGVAERNHDVPVPALATPVALLKGLRITCGSNNAAGELLGVKLPVVGMDEDRCFKPKLQHVEGGKAPNQMPRGKLDSSSLERLKTWPDTAWSNYLYLWSWPGCVQGLGADDPLISLPTGAILSFCELMLATFILPCTQVL